VNKIRSFLLTGILLAGSTTAAFASPIQHTTNPASSSNEPRIPSGFAGPGDVAFVDKFPYSSLNTDPVQRLFSITIGVDTLVFNVTGFDFISGTCYFVGSGIGGEIFTAPGKPGEDEARQLTLNSLPGVAPEPSSFILLATGLLSVCGAAIRRRRATSNAEAA